MGCGITSLQVPRTTRTTTTVTLTTIRHKPPSRRESLDTTLLHDSRGLRCMPRSAHLVAQHTHLGNRPHLSWVATIIRHIDTIPAASPRNHQNATECRLTRPSLAIETPTTCTTSIWIRLAIAATNRRIQTGTLIGILKTNANSASAGRPTLIVD